MDLEDGGLDQADQAVEIVDGEQRLVGILGIAGNLDAAAQSLPGVLLKEALAGDAFGQRTSASGRADDEGGDVPPDLGIVVGQPLLGDAAHRASRSGRDGSALRVARGAARPVVPSTLADDRRRRLVLA